MKTVSRSAIHGQDMGVFVSTLVDDTLALVRSLDVLLESTMGPADHRYVEMVRLSAQLRDTAAEHAFTLAATANRSPASVSIRCLASALGVSVNTFRARLAEIDVPTPSPEDDQ